MAIGLGATCSGCDMSIVDLAEKLANIFKSFEIVFWPTAQDQKLEQLKKTELVLKAKELGIDFDEKIATKGDLILEIKKAEAKNTKDSEKSESKE